MAKNDAADERPGKLKVAVPPELLNRIAAIAEKNGHSTTREVEIRLRASLDSEGQPSPWARAIGRLMTLLADDIAVRSQSAGEAFAAMKIGAATLVDNFLEEWRKTRGTSEVEGVEENTRGYASAMARELAREVRRAHEPQKAENYNVLGEWLRATQPSLRSLRTEELKEIQTALFLSPQFLKEIAAKQTSKGKK